MPNILSDSQPLRLDRLPTELIASIAIFSDASTILSLCRTCRSIRAAVFDSLVFKAYITLNRIHAWDDQDRNQDRELLSQRAGNNPRIWSRFAIADQRALAIHNRGPSVFLVPDEVQSWLAELAVLKHPLLRISCWSDFMDYMEDLPAPYIFARVLNLLFMIDTQNGGHEGLLQCAAKLRRREKRYLDCADISLRTFFWSLRDNIIGLYSRLRMRRAAWPYNTHALVPDIPLPSVDAMPLDPITNDAYPYGIPVPFANRCDDSGRESWTTWYSAHSAALLSSPTFLWEGEWHGYYSVTDGFPDPPMLGIQLRRLPKDDNDGRVWFEAEDCRDGIDQFSLRGRLHWDRQAGEVIIYARKQYTSGTFWQWDCRLTPFGIVGFWGLYSASTMFEKLERHGTVWLWKSEWTEPAGVDNKT